MGSLATASSDYTFKTEGFAELETVLLQMATDFGYKKIGNAFVKPAVDYAFRPVLERARSLAPVQTGQLRQRIIQVSRRATDRDRKMRGASKETAYVSIVRARDLTGKVKAQEFGTARGVEGRHYLRKALENNVSKVVTNLSGGFNSLLIRYQSKYKKKI